MLSEIMLYKLYQRLTNKQPDKDPITTKPTCAEKTPPEKTPAVTDDLGD